jgi:hypothetical protein
LDPPVDPPGSDWGGGIEPASGGVQTLRPGLVICPPMMTGPITEQTVPTVGGVKFTMDGGNVDGSGDDV